MDFNLQSTTVLQLPPICNLQFSKNYEKSSKNENNNSSSTKLSKNFKCQKDLKINEVYKTQLKSHKQNRHIHNINSFKMINEAQNKIIPNKNWQNKASLTEDYGTHNRTNSLKKFTIEILKAKKLMVHKSNDPFSW